MFLFSLGNRCPFYPMKFMLATEKQNSSICAPDPYNRKIVMKTQGHPGGKSPDVTGEWDERGWAVSQHTAFRPHWWGCQHDALWLLLRELQICQLVNFRHCFPTQRKYCPTSRGFRGNYSLCIYYSLQKSHPGSIVKQQLLQPPQQLMYCSQGFQ